MRIRHKILLGYLAIVSVSVVLVAVFLVTIYDINRRYGDIINRDQQVVMQATALRNGISAEIVTVRDYDHTGSMNQIVEYNDALKQQTDAIAAIRPLLTNNEDLQSLNRIQTTGQGFSKATKQILDFAWTGRMQDADDLMKSQGTALGVDLLKQADTFIQLKSNQVRDRQNALEQQIDDTSTRLLIVAVIGVVTALAAATLLTEGITSPLRRLVRNIQGIAAGDLKTAVVVTSHDEVGELSEVLEVMRQRLAASAEQNQTLLDSAREEAEKLAQARHDLEKANTGLEQALATESEARRHIEEINRLTAQFTSMVSHELKTPVSYVYNYAGALKEHNDSLNEGQRREFLTAIQSEAQHLLTLIDDILAVSLLESGGLKHRFAETDLRKLTDAVVKDQQLTTRRHTLTVKGPDTLPVRADPTRLKQVLNNLLSNAIKYSPQGGQIEVRLRANSGDGTALIYVRDYGLGIRSDDVPKLFDRFTRIQRRETMAIPGSGLGLYIAHHIVRAHGGTLSLEPAPGKGTIAQVTVPLMPMAAVAASDGSKNGKSNGAEVPAGDGALVPLEASGKQPQPAGTPRR